MVTPIQKSVAVSVGIVAGIAAFVSGMLVLFGFTEHVGSVGEIAATIALFASAALAAEGSQRRQGES